jgi:DNA (cytosine-5)-methyltransferase 1
MTIKTGVAKGKARPVGIDLFSGAGGLSLGFEQAGFDIVAAVEVDPIHAAIHKFNFPACAVLPRSVTELSAEEIRHAANLGNRKIDIVFGGAPCQGFSLIGQRALDDPRNTLVRDFVRLVSELDASYFVFENVKGLTIGKHRGFLEELIEAFKVVGYHVRSPWRVLNASHYGVPQDRERLILLGAKRGLRLPEYPEPITRPAGAPQDFLGLPEGPSCRDALDDLPEAEMFEELFESDSVRTNAWGKAGAYARQLRCLGKNAWHFGYPREWDRACLTSSMRTNHSEISRRRFRETEPGNVEPISRFYKLPDFGVSNTLRAGTDSARGAFTSPRPIHYDQPRCVTVREMARLHGFPDWFRFHVTKWHGARQVGNAVPPPLARSIAAKILEAMNVQPRKPESSIPLGDPMLLRLDMSQAAKYWGISVPIGRRDRKSGVKKRKQEEIEALRFASLEEAAYG